MNLTTEEKNIKNALIYMLQTAIPRRVAEQQKEEAK